MASLLANNYVSLSVCQRKQDPSNKHATQRLPSRAEKKTVVMEVGWTRHQQKVLKHSCTTKPAGAIRRAGVQVVAPRCMGGKRKLSNVIWEEMCVLRSLHSQL